MSVVESTYTKNSELFLKIFLEIDHHNDLITDFFFQGTLLPCYQNELDELKQKLIHKTLDEALLFKQSDFSSLIDSSKIHSLSLWLVHRAIDKFRGRDEVLKPNHKNLCLCFNIGLDELDEKLSIDPDIELDQFTRETKATTACGGCKNIISKKLGAHRNFLRRRIDSKGKWIKIKGMYPAELVLLLDESLRHWLKNQKVVANLHCEILNIEGYHIDLKFMDDSASEIQDVVLINSLKNFWQEKHGLDLFLHFST
jgi:hypothetical protein